MTFHSWPYYVNEGERIYVIGDIHGQFSSLQFLYDRILSDLNMRPISNFRIIFLGDLVDRGEQARQVIDFLIKKQISDPVLILRGNHEDMLLRAISNADYLLEWRKYGGLETMLSFGVDMSAVMKGRGIAEAHKSFVENFGIERLNFVQSLPYAADSGDYFFCHAGINPDRPISEQNNSDLMWIRDEFLTSSKTFEKFIIHGHTPVEKPDLRVNRLNIDTGAYLTGRLTCAVLEANRAYTFNTRDTEVTSIF